MHIAAGYFLTSCGIMADEAFHSILLWEGMLLLLLFLLSLSLFFFFLFTCFLLFCYRR
jgi:hypothetical protein